MRDLFVILAALAGGPAAAECQMPADLAAIMRESDPRADITVYRGRDAMEFIKALDTIFGNHPPDEVLTASAVGVYVSSFTGDAAMRFFDADNCDMGIQGNMSGAGLAAVIDTMSIGI